MRSGDKAQFKESLERAARKVSKDISQNDVEFFYDELKEYPFEILKAAIIKAMDDRDPFDIYLHRAILTVQETKAAVEKILEGTLTEGRVGCERCGSNAWIMSEDEKGRLVAWPCECLYNVAKEALAAKKGGSHINTFRRRVVKAYEHHEKKWGTMPETKEEGL